MWFQDTWSNKKLLLSILVLALVLRLLSLDATGFWLDESATVIAVENHGPVDHIRNTIAYGTVSHPYFTGTASSDLPVYYILLSIWSWLLGTSEIALRLFSVLCAMGSLVLTYSIGKRLFDERTGILATLIMSLNVLLIFYSQEARTYSFLLLVSLASYVLFERAVERGRTKDFAYFVLLATAGLYTHFVYVFFLFFLGAYTVTLFKNKFDEFVKAAWSFVVLVILYIPGIIRILQQPEGASDYLSSPTVGVVVKFWTMLNSWLYPSPELHQQIIERSFIDISTVGWLTIFSVIGVIALLTMLFVRGLLSENYLPYYVVRKIKEWFTGDTPSLVIVALWFFVPFVSQLAISWLHPTASLFGPVKFLIFIFPAYALIVARGIQSLPHRFVVPIVMAIVVLSVLPLVSYHSHPHKQQWRVAVDDLRLDLAGADMILVNHPTSNAPFDYYWGSQKARPVHTAVEAEVFSQNKNTIWLIYSASKYSDPENTIYEYLFNQFTLTETHHYFDVELFRFERNS